MVSAGHTGFRVLAHARPSPHDRGAPPGRQDPIPLPAHRGPLRSDRIARCPGRASCTSTSRTTACSLSRPPTSPCSSTPTSSSTRTIGTGGGYLPRRGPPRRGLGSLRPPPPRQTELPRLHHRFLLEASIRSPWLGAVPGRVLSFRLLPLSFREYLAFKGVEVSPTIPSLPSERYNIRFLLDEYLIFGGFPEVVLSELSCQAPDPQGLLRHPRL